MTVLQNVYFVENVFTVPLSQMILPLFLKYFLSASPPDGGGSVFFLPWALFSSSTLLLLLLIFDFQINLTHPVWAESKPFAFSPF